MTQQGASGGCFEGQCLEQLELLWGDLSCAVQALFSDRDAVLLGKRPA